MSTNSKTERFMCLVCTEKRYNYYKLSPIIYILFLLLINNNNPTSPSSAINYCSFNSTRIMYLTILLL